MIDRGNGILPNLRLLRNQRTEVARNRSHIAVRQLVPSLGEGFGELFGMLVESPRDFFVSRIEAQRKVRGQHGWSVLLFRIVRIRNRARASAIFRGPLLRACGTLREFPFVAEQVCEKVVTPLRRCSGPCDFQSATDRVAAVSVAKRVAPAQALLLDRSALGLARNILLGIGSAVSLAESMTAGNERNRLLVVHRHAGEGLADIPRRSDRVRLSVGAFRVHINQSHLHSAERVIELAIAFVAPVAEPFRLRSPVNIFFGLPDIRTAASETKRLESHRLEGDVARENHEVSPRNLAAILLLDGPEQATRLVEVHVVGPAVEWRETLLA